MPLIEELERARASETSIFRAQLLKEDIARLTRVAELAETHADRAVFLKHALYIGWTQDDFRTHELKGTLEPLLDAFHAYVRAGRREDDDRTCWALWERFTTARLDLLVGCLARVR